MTDRAESPAKCPGLAAVPVLVGSPDRVRSESERDPFLPYWSNVAL
ncbi:hypothetical protein KRMM14A1004_38580 [Krasilnikovia sp. MM14-A1004]